MYRNGCSRRREIYATRFARRFHVRFKETGIAVGPLLVRTSPWSDCMPSCRGRTGTRVPPGFAPRHQTSSVAHRWCGKVPDAMVLWRSFYCLEMDFGAIYCWWGGWSIRTRVFSQWLRLSCSGEAPSRGSIFACAGFSARGVSPAVAYSGSWRPCGSGGPTPASLPFCVCAINTMDKKQQRSGSACCLKHKGRSTPRHYSFLQCERFSSFEAVVFVSSASLSAPTDDTVLFVKCSIQKPVIFGVPKTRLWTSRDLSIRFVCGILREAEITESRGIGGEIFLGI